MAEQQMSYADFLRATQNGSLRFVGTDVENYRGYGPTGQWMMFDEAGAHPLPADFVPPTAPNAPQYTNQGTDYANGYKTFDKPMEATNPATGKTERVYYTYVDGTDENGNLTQTPTGYFFESDPNRPPEAAPMFAGGKSTGNDKNSILEPLVIGGLAATTGGALGPALAGATGLSNAVATGALTGATAGGIKSEGDLGTMAKGALAGGAGGAVADLGLSQALGGGVTGNVAQGAVVGGTRAAVGGGDITEGALTGAAGASFRDAIGAIGGTFGNDTSYLDAGSDDLDLDAELGLDDESFDQYLEDFADMGEFDDLFGANPSGELQGADVPATQQADNSGDGDAAMDDEDFDFGDQESFTEDYGAGNEEFGGGALEEIPDPENLDLSEWGAGEAGMASDGEGNTTFDEGVEYQGETPDWWDKVKTLGKAGVTTLVAAAKGDKNALTKLAKIGLPTNVLNGLNGGEDDDITTKLMNIGIPAAMLGGMFEDTESPLVGVTKQGVQGALDQAQAFAATPTIGLTPSQQRAIALANDNTGAWKPDMDKSGALVDRATGGISEEEIARYQNPYIRGVLDNQIKDIEAASARRREQLRSTVAMSGNDFRTPVEGGNRFNVEDSLLDGETLDAISEASGRAYSDAYDRATGLAGKDLDRSLSASGVLASNAKTRGALDTVDMANLNTAGALERLPEEDARTKAATASTLYSRAASSAAGAIPATSPKSTLTKVAGALGALKTAKDIGLYGGSTAAAPAPGAPAKQIPVDEEVPTA